MVEHPFNMGFVSDVLHLCSVLCNVREGITTKVLRQISWFGNFEDHSFLSFISSLVKAFPGAPFARSERFYSSALVCYMHCLSLLDISFHSQVLCLLSFQTPLLDQFR